MAAGWFEGRSCNVQKFKEACKINDYDVFPTALAFVERFGWLEGHHRAYRTSDLESFDFNPCKAIDDIYKERVDDYSSRFGEALIPVGEIHNGHLTLMISPSGAVVGGYDDFLCILGEDAESGVNAIFEQSEVVGIE